MKTVSFVGLQLHIPRSESCQKRVCSAHSTTSKNVGLMMHELEQRVRKLYVGKKVWTLWIVNELDETEFSGVPVLHRNSIRKGVKRGHESNNLYL